MAATLLNVPGLGWTDAGGNPLSGGRIYIYQAGTIDTAKASYPTRDDVAAQSNANTHPVVLNSAGRPAADIWVDGRYKAVVTDAADLVIATVDDLGGTDSDDLIPRNYVGGLAVTVSGGDAEHDFVVAAGEARDDADSDDMVLVSALTKYIDAVWAAGTNAGALDTGTVAADMDYYIYLIKSSGTGAVDVLLSASASAPTMPSGYDKKQLIARLVTDASANISAVYGRDEAIAGLSFSKGTVDGTGIAASGANTDITSLAGLTSINGHGQWGFRNLIINGAMRIAQRGAGNITGIGAANTYLNCDRIAFGQHNTPQARFTATQFANGPDGFPYWQGMTVTTAEAAVSATEYSGYEYKIEAQDLQHLLYGTPAAKALAVQFRFRSPKTGIHCVALYQADGDRSYVAEFTVAAANTWETHTVIFPGDTAGTINNDNGEGLRIVWPFVAGTSRQQSIDAWASEFDVASSAQQNLADTIGNIIGLTAIQMEVGPVATAFEHVSYDTDLQRCYRYFQRARDLWNLPGIIYSTSGCVTPWPLYPISMMRADPSVTRNGTFNINHSGGATVTTTVSLAQNGANDTISGIHWSVSGSPLTQWQACTVNFSGGNEFLDLSAEL